MLGRVCVFARVQVFVILCVFVLVHACVIVLVHVLVATAGCHFQLA